MVIVREHVFCVAFCLCLCLSLALSVSHTHPPTAVELKLFTVFFTILIWPLIKEQPCLSLCLSQHFKSVSPTLTKKKKRKGHPLSSHLPPVQFIFFSIFLPHFSPLLLWTFYHFVSLWKTGESYPIAAVYHKECHLFFHPYSFDLSPPAICVLGVYVFLWFVNVFTVHISIWVSTVSVACVFEKDCPPTLI